MRYPVCFKPRSVKDLKKVSFELRRRIVQKIEEMGDNLAGDVKRLTNFTGDVPFDVETPGGLTWLKVTQLG